MSRKGHRDRMDEELWLITDNMNLPALEIVAFYGLRWRIECLFRFLKQKLSLNKFISCTPNGIANMIYIILMTAMLVLLFAKVEPPGLHRGQGPPLYRVGRLPLFHYELLVLQNDR